MSGITAVPGLVGSLLREGFRRPLPYAVGLAACSVIAAGLWLPAAGPDDRLRLVAGFGGTVAFTFLCAVGAVAPTAVDAFLRSVSGAPAIDAAPGGRSGRYLSVIATSSLAAVAFAVVLFVAQAAVLAFLPGAFGDSAAVSPVERIAAFNRDGETALPIGQPVSFAFAPLPAHARNAEFQMQIDRSLARPYAATFGTPLRLTLRNADGGEIGDLLNSRASGDGVRVALPADPLGKGFEIIAVAGDSPFALSVPDRGAAVEIPRGSLMSNLARSTVSSLAAGLFLIAVSALFSRLFSLPVALGASAAVFLAGVLRAPALESLAAFEHFGLMRARHGVPDLPTWFAPYRDGLHAVASAIPDLGRLNRSLDVSQGFWISAPSILAPALGLLMLAIAVATVGLFVARRAEGSAH